MNAKLVLLLLASVAFGQVGGSRFANDLRAKYGPPLARETFMARPDLEMVVDYAANGHVCRIQLPPVASGQEPGVKTTQALDDFLLELVPLSMRGKEMGRMLAATGSVHSESIVRYENVTIAETLYDRRRAKMTVMFNEECHDAPRQ